VEPGFFATLGIPLREGRDVTPGDAYQAPLVAVISKALARKSFPGVDPVGRSIYRGLLDPGQSMKIIGVVGDIRQYGPESAPSPLCRLFIRAVLPSPIDYRLSDFGTQSVASVDVALIVNPSHHS
jgi:hypothetical protein